MKKLEECIIIGGKSAGENVLGKARDRNYKPNLTIVRDLIGDVEIVYMHDKDTDYMEGMNSHGIGIVNSALLVGDDEDAIKGLKTSMDGRKMRRALQQTKLSDAIKSLVGYGGGIRGHTLAANSKNLYHIEMTSKHNPLVKKLKGGNEDLHVMTNHGIGHPHAGYQPETHPDDHLSSKIRKATAETILADVESDHEAIMPSLAAQAFEPDSNFNVLRRTNKMNTNSQLMMHLETLEFFLYIFPEQCNFRGLDDRTPEGYSPKITIKLFNYKE